MPNPCEDCWTTYSATKADLLNQLNTGKITQTEYDTKLAAAWDALKTCLTNNGCVPPEGDPQ